MSLQIRGRSTPEELMDLFQTMTQTEQTKLIIDAVWDIAEKVHSLKQGELPSDSAKEIKSLKATVSALCEQLGIEPVDNVPEKKSKGR